MNNPINSANKNYNSTDSFPTDWLEGIKALAILWVAWYHIDQLILPDNNSILSIRSLADLGRSGVNVFLLLSGFGLAVSMTSSQIKSFVQWKKLPWKKFFIRRFLRIYPLYVFAHLLFFSLGILVGKYEDMPLNIGFLLSITGLRVFFPEYFWYGPDTFWFVGLILQLYILFPFLFWILSKKGQIKFLILAFVICAISRIITNSLDNSYIFMLGLAPNRLAEFALGMAIGYGTITKKGLQLSLMSLKNKVFWLITIVSILLSALLYWGNASILRLISLDLVLSVGSFTLITVIVRLLINVPIAERLLKWMGGASYAFYLLHSPPIRPVFAGFNKIGLDNFLLKTLLYIVITAFISFIIYRCEENFIYSRITKKLA